MKKIIFLLLLLFNGMTVFSQEHGSFRPEYDKKYLVSCWVREVHPVQQPEYTHTNLSIDFLTPSGVEQTSTFTPSGNIIDGWQRIVGVLTVPSEQTGVEMDIKIRLVNEGSINAFFDDIRFMPYNGSLKSFVYDADMLKLLAELDENNYATFYEYDQEGGLIRVKKETENGVFTVQESRSSNSK